MLLFSLHIKIKSLSNWKWTNYFSTLHCAFQTQLLDINRYEKVFEVGTGSGYQSAVLIGGFRESRFVYN